MRVVKRSASQAVKSGRSHRGVPLPAFVPFQLSQPVEKPPSGAQWLHEIKLDGYRIAARIDNGRAQLLTRTGLDWTDKYPSVIAALADLHVKTAYLDGELCGVDDAGLPSFAHTQAATDGDPTRRGSRAAPQLRPVALPRRRGCGGPLRTRRGPREDRCRLAPRGDKANRYGGLCIDGHRSHRGVARCLRAESEDADLARCQRSGETERIRSRGADQRTGSGA
jgi:ATP dependent DNA ligase domain